jgi:hypothetical protein
MTSRFGNLFFRPWTCHPILPVLTIASPMRRTLRKDRPLYAGEDLGLDDGRPVVDAGPVGGFFRAAQGFLMQWQPEQAF